MSETLIESQIYSYRQFKTVVGLNFITSDNCATEIWQFWLYKSACDFYVNSEVFFRLREQWMYTLRYTQSSPVDHAPVSYYCCVICVISLLFPRFKTQRKCIWRYRQLFIIILYKTAKIILILVIKTRN